MLRVLGVKSIWLVNLHTPNQFLWLNEGSRVYHVAHGVGGIRRKDLERPNVTVKACKKVESAIPGLIKSVAETYNQVQIIHTGSASRCISQLSFMASFRSCSGGTHRPFLSNCLGCPDAPSELLVSHSFAYDQTPLLLEVLSTFRCWLAKERKKMIATRPVNTVRSKPVTIYRVPPIAVSSRSLTYSAAAQPGEGSVSPQIPVKRLKKIESTDEGVPVLSTCHSLTNLRRIIPDSILFIYLFYIPHSHMKIKIKKDPYAYGAHIWIRLFLADLHPVLGSLLAPWLNYTNCPRSRPWNHPTRRSRSWKKNLGRYPPKDLQPTAQYLMPAQTSARPSTSQTSGEPNHGSTETANDLSEPSDNPADSPPGREDCFNHKFIHDANAIIQDSSKVEQEPDNTAEEDLGCNKANEVFIDVGPYADRSTLDMQHTHPHPKPPDAVDNNSEPNHQSSFSEYNDNNFQHDNHEYYHKDQLRSLQSRSPQPSPSSCHPHITTKNTPISNKHSIEPVVNISLGRTLRKGSYKNQKTHGSICSDSGPKMVSNVKCYPSHLLMVYIHACFLFFLKVCSIFLRRGFLEVSGQKRHYELVLVKLKKRNLRCQLYIFEDPIVWCKYYNDTGEKSIIVGVCLSKPHPFKLSNSNKNWLRNQLAENIDVVERKTPFKAIITGGLGTRPP
ncbi:hypothetical protein VP01_30g2 [Puccinia sorghi]|uniref:Uncharacterized protein n=1 Tax=Puccinia sorghi TaxID=27349 RepID=A0A0L6UZK8_9BASI|nr:hypothetical protein VP01_30g2 [Puccinia sorghi]